MKILKFLKPFYELIEKDYKLTDHDYRSNEKDKFSRYLLNLEKENNQQLYSTDNLENINIATYTIGNILVPELLGLH